MTAVRVLLLEAGGPEATAIADTAAARGYQVHAATQPDQHAGYSPELRGVLSGCLLTSFSHPEHALSEVTGYARDIRAGAVLTTNEYLTPLAAQVCAELGLPGNDPALTAAARNKADMIREFNRCGVTAPRSHIVNHEDDLYLRASTGRLAFPWVIKPAEGVGSAGVTIVAHTAGAITAFRAAQAQRGMYGTVLDQRVLVQELVEGTEYSVETVTHNGASTHLCFTRKIVTSGARRVELGHSLPAVLPPDVEQTVHKQVDLAIAAVGIRNGASHTEVMVTPDGQCVVIETAARIGAGQIGFLIQHALGIDPWAACLDTALGRPPRLTPTRSRYATVRFLTAPRSGRLTKLAGFPNRGPEVPTVRMRKTVGDTVTGPDCNAARLASFIAVGSDQRAVDDHAERLLARVRIDVEPAEVSTPRLVR